MYSLFAFAPERKPTKEVLVAVIQTNDNLLRNNNETLKRCMVLRQQPQITSGDSISYRLTIPYRALDQSESVSKPKDEASGD